MNIETTSILDVAALAHRVARLEAEREIQRLLVRYAESLDYGANERWAQCFAPDGRFVVLMRGEPMFTHTGTMALSDFAAQHSHAPDVYHKHFVSIPR